MGRALLILRNAADKAKAVSWIAKAPYQTRIEFKSSKRTLPQNARFWAMLTDLSEQGEHFGRRYSTDEWKVIILAALGKETRFIPSLDGNSFIPIGRSSSDLSIDEMIDAIEIMFAWGAEHGVKFREPDESACSLGRSVGGQGAGHAAIEQAPAPASALIGVTPETLQRETEAA